MAKEYSKEWWRWRINRKLADYMDEPSDASRNALDALLSEYRQSRELQRYTAGTRDEHEWAMDWH